MSICTKAAGQLKFFFFFLDILTAGFWVWFKEEALPCLLLMSLFSSIIEELLGSRSQTIISSLDLNGGSFTYDSNRFLMSTSQIKLCVLGPIVPEVASLFLIFVICTELTPSLLGWIGNVNLKVVPRNSIYRVFLQLF